MVKTIHTHVSKQDIVLQINGQMTNFTTEFVSVTVPIQELIILSLICLLIMSVVNVFLNVQQDIMVTSFNKAITECVSVFVPLLET